MKCLYIILAVIIGAVSCKKEKIGITIPCTDSSTLSFVDPLNQEFYLVSSDTISDHDQEWTIYRKYISKRDTSRYFTTENNTKNIVDCSVPEGDEDLLRESERLFKMYGVRSIYEKYIFKKDNRSYTCLRYNKNNYIITFCSDSNYIRMELSNFCDSDDFKSLLNSLELSE